MLAPKHDVPGNSTGFCLHFRVLRRAFSAGRLAQADRAPAESCPKLPSQP